MPAGRAGAAAPSKELIDLLARSNPALYAAVAGPDGEISPEGLAMLQAALGQVKGGGSGSSTTNAAGAAGGSGSGSGSGGGAAAAAAVPRTTAPPVGRSSGSGGNPAPPLQVCASPALA